MGRLRRRVPGPRLGRDPAARGSGPAARRLPKGRRVVSRPARTPLLLAVTAAALIAGCDVPRPGGQVGSPAPEYTAFTLDGEQVTLESLRGEVVLFNVWATWCAPCREEIPELQRLHEQFSARGLRVVGVSVDVGGNDGVKRFADDLGVMYDVLRDPMDRASAVFGFTGIPGTVLISRDGELLWRHVGPVTADDPRLRDALQAAL